MAKYVQLILLSKQVKDIYTMNSNRQGSLTSLVAIIPQPPQEHVSICQFLVPAKHRRAAQVYISGRTSPLIL